MRTNLNKTLNAARACAISAAALCGALIINGCSLFSSESPPPPTPAIITSSSEQIKELDREIREKDSRIATLSRELDASKEEVAQLKEQKDTNSSAPALSDAGNSNPNGDDSNGDGSYSGANPGAYTGNRSNIAVWVSSSSSKFFMSGSPQYGKGVGQYMTEEQAINDGYKRGGRH